MTEPKSRIIIVDWGFYTFASINAYSSIKLKKLSNPNLFLAPLEWYTQNMLYSDLKKVGVTIFDQVMIAVDYKSSWRKNFDENYKGNRKGLREKQTHINWDESFNIINDLLNRIDHGTTFNILKEEHFEADDFMSVACRYYKDNEVIIISADADLEQLLIYPNVKIFSPHPKSKRWKFNKNPYKLLAKKIEKETADNLISEIKGENSYDVRKLVVSLLELPEFVEGRCIEIFKNLKIKEYENIEVLPCKSMREKYSNIYNNQNIIEFKEKIKRKRRKANESRLLQNSKM